MNSRAARAVEAVKPSTSTVASAFGGAFAIVVAWLVEEFTARAIPAHVVAALTTMLTLGAGFAFPGGRSVDTK